MEIGSVSRPIAGESICGDQVVVSSCGPDTLIAVVDGLGHGEQAARASGAACAIIEAHRSEALPELLRRCHAELRATRGAAITLIRIDQASARLWHVGIGNVEVTGSCREPIRPIALPGVVGERIRKVLQTDYGLQRGDRLAIHSDGISGRFDLSAYRHLDAQSTAEAILADWGQTQDDATCVVVVY